MEQFVCLRIVKANSMDLSLFQFDYDLTFAAFMLNADKTIYGRFGTRSDFKDATRNISMEGFGKALAGALELHKHYPANKAALKGKTGPPPRFRVPEAYPSLRKFKSTLDYAGNVTRSCIFCHRIHDAERKVYRSARQPIPDTVLYPWPLPDVLGLSLDPKEKAKVTRVWRGSPAAREGFRRGDEILTLEGQPMLSIADVQWVLQNAREPARLKAEVRRGGQKKNLTLTLARGWRRKSNISWRTSTWDLRRMGTGGLVLEDLPAAERQRMRFPATALALRVKYVGQYGAHAAGKRAGFRKGDVIVALDGKSGRLTETGLLAYVLRNKAPGQRVPVTVLRGGRRMQLKLPMQ